MTPLYRPLIMSVLLSAASGFAPLVHGDEADSTAVSDGDTVLLNSEHIQSLNVQTVVELLNRIPGVRASDLTVSLQGSSSKHVLVLLDGRPLNDPVSGWVDLSGISAERIKEVKVVKGSGAVQYGDNTSGGVVLITTRETTKDVSSKVEAHYGSYDTRKLLLELANTNRGTGLELILNADDTDGYRINDDEKNRSAALTISRTFRGGVDTRLSLSHSDKESGYAGKVFSPTPNARSDKSNTGLLLNIGKGNIESRTYYNGFDDRYRDPDRDMDNELSSSVVGEELRYTGTFSTGMKIEQQSAESSYFGSQDEDQQSAFLMKGFPLSGSNRKDTTTGIRVNRHSEFGVSVNPQLGINMEHGNAKLGMEFNRSSNIPSFKQRYYESTFTKGNPDLDMETATNFKATVSYRTGPSYFWSASGFYNKIDDAIAYIQNPDKTSTYRNIAASTRKGIDASVDWTITPTVKLNLAYLYLRFTDDDTDLLLPNKPEHAVKANLDVTAGKSLLTFTGEWKDKSYIDKANTETLPGYFVVDAKLSYRLNGTRILAKVENLLDKDYEVHEGYPAAGRNYLVGISHQF